MRSMGVDNLNIYLEDDILIDTETHAHLSYVYGHTSGVGSCLVVAHLCASVHTCLQNHSLASHNQLMLVGGTMRAPRSLSCQNTA